MTLHRWTIRWDEQLGDLGGYRVGGTEPFPDAPVAVVPADDAAVERATQAIIDNYSYDDDDPNWARDLAVAVLRAAGEPDAPSVQDHIDRSRALGEQSREHGENAAEHLRAAADRLRGDQ